MATITMDTTSSKGQPKSNRMIYISLGIVVLAIFAFLFTLWPPTKTGTGSDATPANRVEMSETSLSPVTNSNSNQAEPQNDGNTR